MIVYVSQQTLLKLGGPLRTINDISYLAVAGCHSIESLHDVMKKGATASLALLGLQPNAGLVPRAKTILSSIVQIEVMNTRARGCVPQLRHRKMMQSHGVTRFLNCKKMSSSWAVANTCPSLNRAEACCLTSSKIASS